MPNIFGSTCLSGKTFTPSIYFENTSKATISSWLHNVHQKCFWCTIFWVCHQFGPHDMYYYFSGLIKNVNNGLTFMCLFCMDLYQDMDPSSSHCNLKPILLQSGCKAESIESPVSSIVVEEDRPLSDRAQGSIGDITQIRPQRIHLTLRPGMTWLECRQ